MASDAPGPRQVGRYVIHEEFASGGMASVHFGRLLAPAGFTRIVAVKRLHPQHARDPELVAMLLDEARIVTRIRHPNVVPILDVVTEDGEVLLVMEYVHGEALASLLRDSRRGRRAVPARIASSILSGALHGLAAAHAAKSETGEPLGIVHRDISPENVLVGADGVARVLDFGVALANVRSRATRLGEVKGKIGYMAPELLDGSKATPLSDVYSAGVVLWETLAGRRLFVGDHEGAIVAQTLRGDVPRPSSVAPLPERADDVVLRALARSPGDRYLTAGEFARALEACFAPASAREVGDWVASASGSRLDERAAQLAVVERAAAAASSPAHRPPAPSDMDPTEVIHASDVRRPAPPDDVRRPAPPTVRRPPPPDEETGPTHVIAGLATPHAVTTPAPGPPSMAARRRIGALALAAAALALAGGIAGIVVGARTFGERSGTPSAPSASASALAVESAAPPETSAPAAPASASAPAVAGDAGAPAAASSPPDIGDPAAPASSASASTAASSHAGPKQGPHGRPPAAPSNCNPPYTVDERGLHHYKPGCL
jgi:eukaryotic-like serine/threonine-protein kinase